MSNTFGSRIALTVFGSSHGPGIGCTLEGLPAGFSIDLPRLSRFLRRRAPGHSPLSTSRAEEDQPEFLSGLQNGVTTGGVLTAFIPNRNTRSRDYDNLRTVPRPGHADFTAQAKFHGFQETAGGGVFSGRLTAPLCVAGGICIQLLEQQGIAIAAHIQQIEQVFDTKFDPVNTSKDTLDSLLNMSFPILDSSKEGPMKEAILTAKEEGDSVGGVIECICTGLPAGLGDPMFGGLENRIAQAVFGIPAIRGIEFGAGFAAASMRGSEHNDPFFYENGQVRTTTNHHGGILGGISSGMPLLFRVCVKPTPSIGKPQQSVDLAAGENTQLTVSGRHDPCIVPRAVPVVEAAAALAILDAML